MDCYCNEIVQNLQTKKPRSTSYLGAFRLLGEFKPQSFIRPLIKYLSCSHCFLSIFRLLVGILAVIRS